MKKLVFLLMIVGFMASCSKDQAVKYSVSGISTGGFDVTYDNDGNTEQSSGVSSGWSKSISCEKGAFVYISAQANGENASVHVSISVNGKVIEEANSNGSYVIATASGTND